MSDQTCVTCDAPDEELAGVSFEEALAAYSSRKFWISFFVRPCCPPPGADQAKLELEKQRDQVRARADFSEDQKAQLIAAIDGGEAWYKTTPYWHKGENK